MDTIADKIKYWEERLSYIKSLNNRGTFNEQITDLEQFLSDLKELNQEPKGLRWVIVKERNPKYAGYYFVRGSSMGIAYYSENGWDQSITEWLEETPLEAAQNIKP